MRKNTIGSTSPYCETEHYLADAAVDNGSQFRPSFRGYTVKPNPHFLNSSTGSMKFNLPKTIRFGNLYLLGITFMFVAGCNSDSKIPTDPVVPGGGNGQPVLLSSADVTELEYSPTGIEHHDRQGRVRVEVASAWSEDGLYVIRAKFTPDDQGFHLYSHSLPKTGIDNLGRPTLVEVSDQERFSEIGELISDKKTKEHHDEILEKTFPIFPDGSVTLYLPLRFRSPEASSEPIALQLTYMACGENTCHKPVEGATVQVDVPPRLSGP